MTLNLKGTNSEEPCTRPPSCSTPQWTTIISRKPLAVTHILSFQTSRKITSHWCHFAGQLLAKKTIVYYLFLIQCVTWPNKRTTDFSNNNKITCLVVKLHSINYFLKHLPSFQLQLFCHLNISHIVWLKYIVANFLWSLTTTTLE